MRIKYCQCLLQSMGLSRQLPNPVPLSEWCSQNPLLPSPGPVVRLETACHSTPGSTGSKKIPSSLFNSPLAPPRLDPGGPCWFTGVCVCVYKYICVFVRESVHTSSCVSVCECVCVCVCMCVCVSVCVNTKPATCTPDMIAAD